MKEITRIHIAKIPYDIEVTAKKELEKYIGKLELYADDENLLEDIEIRITEILSSRGIEKDGVIASQDVKAIREQLGEPQDFMGEGDIAIGAPDVDDSDKPRHRLYRDTDSNILGGVLSGMAKYAGINPLWTRLIFLILLIVSWGIAMMVYVVLWIVLPPAKTTAEKLELSGKPVTLASIKALSEAPVSDSNASRIFQNILIYGGAITLIIGAAMSFVATVWAGSGLLISAIRGSNFYNVIEWGTWSAWISYAGFVLAGLLLTALLALLSYALFSRKWTKRLTIATIVVVISGVIAFGGGIGSLFYNRFENSQAAFSAKTTERVNLGNDFKNLKNLTVDLKDSIYVKYIIDDGAPHYEVSAIRGTYAPDFKINGDSATLTATTKPDKRSIYVPASLTIYGPALNSVTVNGGSFNYYNKNHQDSLAVTTNNSQQDMNSYSSFNISGGSLGTVTASSQFNSNISLDSATVETLNANLNGGYISAGVIRNLTVAQADVCPTNNYTSSPNRLVVQAVASGKLTYNNKEQNAATISGNCGEVIIGSESDYETARYQNY